MVFSVDGEGLNCARRSAPQCERVELEFGKVVVEINAFDGAISDTDKALVSVVIMVWLRCNSEDVSSFELQANGTATYAILPAKCCANFLVGH
jgi:hypothetical protein